MEAGQKSRVHHRSLDTTIVLIRNYAPAAQSYLEISFLEIEIAFF
jgi:hypothetical protein